MHKPRWFQEDKVVISTARTCGINKDGHDLYVVDPATGKRTDTIDDQLLLDVQSILNGHHSESVHYIPLATILERRIAVPAYYDLRYQKEFRAEVRERWPHFRIASIKSLIESGELIVRRGHGSPSLDLRTGGVPYIKVSDLRAGFVNINPTNMVPEVVARRYWKGDHSGLQAFDLISPERASKNIGDFCVLMPGQERIVLTREVLVFRPGKKAQFDSFYLLWALSLRVVRQQWQRVVLMQTNREDVGERYLDIELPIAPDRVAADEVSVAFRRYYEGVAALREEFRSYLEQTGIHHFFLGVADSGESQEIDQSECAATVGGDSKGVQLPGLCETSSPEASDT